MTHHVLQPLPFPHILGASHLPVNVGGYSVSPTVISVKWDLLRACSPVSDLTVKCRIHHTAEGISEVQSFKQMAPTHWTDSIRQLLHSNSNCK